MIQLNKNAVEIVNRAEENCLKFFKSIEQTEFENQLKVLINNIKIFVIINYKYYKLINFVNL